MFSASYQRYSGARRGEACSRDAETRGRGDAGNSEVVRKAHSTIKRTTQRKLMNAFLWSIGQAAQSYPRVEQLFHRKWYRALSLRFQKCIRNVMPNPAIHAFPRLRLLNHSAC